MRIALPFSSSYPYVTVILMTPKGERTATVNRSFHSFVDIELPEGVEEAEVDVYSCFRDAGGHVPSGCGPALIQGAVRKIESALSMVGLQAAEPAAGAAPAVAVPAATAPVADAAPVDLASADTTPAITGSTDAAPVAAVAPVDAAPAVDTAPAEVAPVADATPANAAPVADPAPAQAAPAADAPAVADAAPLADAAPANAAPAAG
jgi:hypothetical protein